MNPAVRYVVLALVVAVGAGLTLSMLPRGPQTATEPGVVAPSNAPGAAGKPDGPAVTGKPERAAGKPGENPAAPGTETAETPNNGPAGDRTPGNTAVADGQGPGTAPEAVEPARGTMPVISTTSSVPEYRAAELRLARFINALQLERRERAAGFLSSRVPDSARQALRERRWLRSDSTRPDDFSRVLFIKDLQIRPRGTIQGDVLKLYVIPRAIPVTLFDKNRKKSKKVIGYLEIPMRREEGEWRVELTPAHTS